MWYTSLIFGLLLLFFPFLIHIPQASDRVGVGGEFGLSIIKKVSPAVICTYVQLSQTSLCV